MSGHPERPETPHETVPSLLEALSDEMGEAPLMLFEDRVLSYAEMNARANAVANALAQRGIESGDHVATLLYNSPEHLSVLFGVAKLGGVAVPINVNVKANGLAHIVNDSDSKVVIVEKETVDNYEAIRDDVGNVREAYVLGTERDGYHPFDELLDGDRNRNPEPSVELSDPMSIIYTSGTTGLPKGVVLPHYSYINTGMRTATMFELTDDDRLFTTLPLFHCNAQQTTVMAAMLAKTSFAMERWFSASNFWDQIRTYDVTHFNFIGTMLTALDNQPRSPDDADNPASYGIGAPVPDGFYDEFDERFGVQLVEGYGLTETATSAARNPPDEIRAGSFGKPHPHLEMDIVDEFDRSLPPGEHGEIVVRSSVPYTMMSGYYNQPEQTLEACRNFWFHTGDIGYKDDDGYFYFVDRKAHSIRRRGENIASAEVEMVLDEHPSVAESAVVGVPSELGEEDVKAYIQFNGSQAPSELDLVKWCEDRLAYFKIPRYIEFVDDFPKTPTERIRKHELKQRGIGDVWDRNDTDYEISR